jgi:hypothetical protein
LTQPRRRYGGAVRRETIIKRISRLATTVVVSAGLAAAGLGTPTASAQGPSYQGGNCPAGLTCTHWFPGDPTPPGGQVLSWDWAVPHDWYWNSEGIVDVTTNIIYPWQGAPRQAAPPPVFGPPPPPPPPLPPGTPFCSPRGALIIIPPICDEIGVDNPPGSVRR